MSTMNHVNLAALVLVAIIGTPVLAGHEESHQDAVHLFILSGQSNMAGLDPEVSFIPVIQKEFGKENIVVVKDAKGGEPIHRWYRNWRSDGRKEPEIKGDLYDRLMGKVTKSIAGKDLLSVTFVWMQGERDAREKFGDVYEPSLKGLIDQLSNDLSRDDINCVVGRLSDFDMADRRYRHWTKVREAQVAFANSSPRFAWVNTDDLNDGVNRAGKPIENDLHYSVEGYQSLGSRFAHKAIEIIKSFQRPNVILVMADDQGWGDVGFNGHPFVQTPELDAMAAEGLVFNRFYAAAPVCSPTRASVMTGRNPIRSKVTHHGRYMRPNEQTIAESLKDAGYVTGMFGKFHLGSGQPDSPCNPSGAGFDEWVIGLNFFDNDPYLSRNGRIERRQGKGSEIAMDDALEFVRKHQGHGQPMFVVIWFPAPHDPHQEVPDGPALYDGRKHAGYYREITLLDQQVGRLRRELQKLNIDDNTLVWYCSDNGGLVESTSGGRKKKGSVYEGGLRVPAVVQWPKQNLSGICTVPAWTCDIFPTVMAMTGVHSDVTNPGDGIDLSNIMKGKVSLRDAPMGFWHQFQKGQATWSDRINKSILEKQMTGAAVPYIPDRIRKDVDEFPQFAEDTVKGHAAWNKWPWKLHRINGEKYELYNLDDDPMETTDLSNEPGHAQRTESMKSELHDWMRSVIRSINGNDYDVAELPADWQNN